MNLRPRRQLAPDCPPTLPSRHLWPVDCLHVSGPRLRKPHTTLNKARSGGHMLPCLERQTTSFTARRAGLLLVINTCNSSAADGQRPSPLTGSQAALFEEIQGTIANLADQKKGGTCLCHIPRQGLATSRSQLSGERHHPHDSGAATWLGKTLHVHIYMYICTYICMHTHSC